MAKKREKGLIEQKKAELTTDQVLAHPVVQQMVTRLEALNSLLTNLPSAVGQAVAEAMETARRNRPPDGASGPPVRIMNSLDDFRPRSDGKPLETIPTLEIGPGRISAQGQSFELNKPKPAPKRKEYHAKKIGKTT